MNTGERIGERYEILGGLGHGGSARIYRARDVVLERDVAIKVLTTPAEGELALDLKREAHLLAQLQHPGVVAVYDFGRHEGAFYLVMELIAGRTLQGILDREELDEADALSIARDVAEAMASVHEQGIVHRDLTLANIMRSEPADAAPSIKLLDFGIGRADGVKDEWGDVALGTARYMPPEQFLSGETDERSDIYTFGVCLYRLCERRFPFDDHHLAALEYKVLNELPPKPQRAMPDSLVELLQRCLEKDPARRPQSFREVLADLGRVEWSRDPKSTSAEPAATAPRQGNPYLNRVMIQDVRDFVGRTREIRKIYTRLDASPPQSISVVGDRRIGKSSLLNYLYNKTNRRRFMQHAAEAVFVFLDFQSDIDFTAEHFLSLVLKGMPASCVDSRSRSATPVFRDLERAVQRLDAEGRRLIVLMDEFEKITGNPNFEQGFFSFLRHLANHYQVAYVTSSEAELMRMCHARVIADSPFFNIFSNLPLGPFTREEARDLVVGASSEAGVSLEPYAEELVRLGGRIPMYLQILCCAYFDEVSSDPTAEVRWVDVRDECMNELRPHFEFVWQRMGEIEKQVLRTLARGGKLPAAQRHHVEELRSRGLVQMEAQQPRVFSEAFAAYVQEQDDTGGGWLKKVFRRGK